MINVCLIDNYDSFTYNVFHYFSELGCKVTVVRNDKFKIRYLNKFDKIAISPGPGNPDQAGLCLEVVSQYLNKIPFLGICFGMQMAVIEFARNILKIKNASSSEISKNGVPVVGLIDEWEKDGRVHKGTDKNLGGTMRLGLYPAKLKENSLIKKIYNSKIIHERHRHRYEVNINFLEKFEEKKMIFSGVSPDNKLPEAVEYKNHPWFIGVQFHPEFKSRPLAPHPLFSSFIAAAKKYK